LLPYLEQQAQYTLYIFDAAPMAGASKTGPYNPSDPTTLGYAYYNIYVADNGAYDAAQGNQSNRPRTGVLPIARPNPNYIYGCEGNFKVFRCPSAPGPEECVSELMAVLYDDGNAGTTQDPQGTGQGIWYPWGITPGGHTYSADPGRQVLGHSDYTGIGGECRNDPIPGTNLYYSAFFGMLKFGSKTTIGRVPDGSSNTLLYGEMAGGWINWNGSGGIPSGWNDVHWSCGFNFSCFGLDPRINTNDGGHGWWSYGSLHSGGITQFAYADGHVGKIIPTIDFNVWEAINGYQDGIVVQSQDNG
jgi:prepilin-type processing-associated H-X9-DG protein